MAPRDADEPDLYPPDVEHLTPELRQQRFRAMVGAGLVTFGIGLLLERAFGHDFDYLFLAVGIALLAGWARAPRFPMFAVGSIMTGFALGEFFESIGHIRFESTVASLLAAAGFFAVYVRYPKIGRWAIIPTIIMAVIAVWDFGVGLIGLVPGAITGNLLPFVLIGGGVLLLFRHQLPRPVVKCGLIAALVVFVSSAMSGMAHWDGPQFPFSRHALDPITIPDLDGRTLVIITESGDVDVATLPGVTPLGAEAIVSAEVTGHGDGKVTVDMRGSDDAVVRLLDKNGSPFRQSRNADYHVLVAAGTNVNVRTESGDIHGFMQGGENEYRTDNGDVDLVVLPGPEGSDESITIGTDNGDVDMAMKLDEGSLRPHITVQSANGDIDVNGEEVDEEEYRREGPGMTIDIRTDNGDVVLEGVPEAA